MNKDSILLDDVNIFLIYRNDSINFVNVELDIKDLSISPQPSSDRLILKPNNFDYINADISIFNNLGKKVFQTQKNIFSNQDNVIETNSLATGLYFLVLTNGN